MKSTILAALIFGLLALFSCTQNRPETSQTPPTVAVPADNPEATKIRFHSLKGTIGDLPVTVFLTEQLRSGEAVPFFSGHYFYEKTAEPISIGGERDSDLQAIRLEEQTTGDSPNTVEGNFATDGSFSGTWFNASRSKSMPVHFLPADGAVRFDSKTFSELKKARPELANSPQATVEQTWLFPDSKTEAGLKIFLENEIRKGMVGDSLAATVGSPEAAFAAFSKGIFDSHAIDSKDFNPADSTDSPQFYQRDEFGSMSIFTNENKLLTIGFLQYSYAGGAHGNYGTTIRSFDLANKKALNLTDVFKPGFEQKLTVALHRNARRLFGLKPKQKLGTVLFEDEIPLTDNFGLTTKGIFFNYAPYEIASYAQGEIRVFVPFEEVKELLAADFMK